ncbi:helix-turn-helix transcriptional regulator, partial [Streptomyces sp. H39-C1]|uniref:helix-turn-helix transcriptional regulator n=1 Tax=Streptomyces sp. H39-C1 TaxID=3004355 RepID=UPI0022AE709F
YRGHGYLKGYGPRMVRTWTLDDDGVRDLPKSVWQRGSTVPAGGPGGGTVPAASGGRRLHLVKPIPSSVAVPATSAPATLTDTEAAVLNAVRAESGPVRQRDVVTACGLAKGTVSKTVTKLVTAGLLVRADDGTLTAKAGMVSA